MQKEKRNGEVGFADLGLRESTLKTLREIEYVTPSPIQAAFIPLAVKGGDCTGQARTGTGKTAAFVLPIIERIDLDNRVSQALVLAPTRELSEQVAIPVSLRQVIEVLNECNEPELVKWRNALLYLYLGNRTDEYRRFDLVSYVCGKRPVRNPTWIPVNQPLKDYRGNRRFEAVEAHLHDVDGLVRYVFDKSGSE